MDPTRLPTPTLIEPITPFPRPPEGLSRFDHPATVGAALRHWREAEALATSAGDARRARVAAALVASYEAASKGLEGRATPDEVAA